MAQSFRCGKDSALYCYRQALAAVNTAITEADVLAFAADRLVDPFSGGTWARLPHTKSFSLSPNVTEGAFVRTSDTGGLRRKACSDSVSYSAEVTSYLDDADWLLAYILADEQLLGGVIGTRWYCITTTAGDSVTNAAAPMFDSAIFFAGVPTPGGISFDNEEDTPQSMDWTLSVSLGPVFPAVTAFTQGSSGLFIG